MTRPRRRSRRLRRIRPTPAIRRDGHDGGTRSRRSDPRRPRRSMRTHPRVAANRSSRSSATGSTPILSASEVGVGLAGQRIGDACRTQRDEHAVIEHAEDALEDAHRRRRHARRCSPCDHLTRSVARTRDSCRVGGMAPRALTFAEQLAKSDGSCGSLAPRGGSCGICLSRVRMGHGKGESRSMVRRDRGRLRRLSHRRPDRAAPRAPQRPRSRRSARHEAHARLPHGAS